MSRRVIDRPLLLASLVLAVGCRPSSESADVADLSATATTPATTAARPAFVVLTAEQTLVIPVDPGLAVETLPGHWVGALPGAAPGAFGRVPVELTTRVAPQLATLPVCPSLASESRCSLYLDPDQDPAPPDRLADATGTVVATVEVVSGQAPRWRLVDPRRGSDCTCVEVTGLSSDEIMLEPDDDESPLDLRSCGEVPDSDTSPRSYVGGVLYMAGLYNNMACSGFNEYEGISEAVPLRPGATPPAAGAPEPTRCHAKSFLDPAIVDAPADEVTCTPDEDVEIFALSRGRLVRLVGSSEGFEESDCTCVGTVPLTAASCRSALDPCGHGAGLSGRDAWPELWAATDERVALGQDAEGLAVLAENGTTIRRVPSPGEILGVELHPDTALLGVTPPPRALRVSIPARDASDASFEGSAKQWGNRCFSHLQAGRLDAAETACFAGLLVESTRSTRGALTYNLGRIEEARGDRARARAYYERSQELRPHDATAKRLRELGGE